MRLDEAVAQRAGVTRSRARSLIMAGRVRVDGKPMTKAGTAVTNTAVVEVQRPRAYVSRGGEKLEAALSAFGIDARGRRVLDVGASTGGFTHCLLTRGAAEIVALDVGYGQLAAALRDDPRVRVLERCNFRLLAPGAFDRPFDLITIDASFISVRTMIARALAELARDGDIVALIKPQFEAGRKRLGGGGVVRDPDVRREVLHETLDGIERLGAVPVAVVRSPLQGPAGNVEFFAHVRRSGERVSNRQIEAALS
ncbi:MAG: TlyA family RNA methyltransferase [Candidatus Eremiobacteraeota bacterium]|nr:TlyA family RNA methyltransferase [Candidatus Eremiobacteraeota bacterium]